MTTGVEILKKDHRKVEGLFEQYRSSPDPAVTEQVCNELTVHAAIEEQVLYPVLPEVRGGEEMREEAEREHQEVKDAIAQIEAAGYDAPEVGPLMEQIIGGVSHHVEEEEGEIFPRLESDLGKDRLTALGDQLMAAKREQLVALGMLIDLTKEELVELAQSADIENRSGMTKEELVAALEQ